MIPGQDKTKGVGIVTTYTGRQGTRAMRPEFNCGPTMYVLRKKPIQGLRFIALLRLKGCARCVAKHPENRFWGLGTAASMLGLNQ